MLYRSTKGFTLIELMIALSVITTMIVGASMAMTTSIRYSNYLKEEAAAARVAEALLAEVRAANFSTIVATYDGLTRDVELIPNQVTEIRYSDDTKIDEAEFVIITDETPNEADYGRDIETFQDKSVVPTPDGSPDGIDLDDNVDRTNTPSSASNSLFPMDLNGDGDTTDDLSATPGTMRLIPVVVIIRWRTSLGANGRYQAMDIIRIPD